MRVELLGIPRERAGVGEVELQAETLGELLSALAVRYPALGELIRENGLPSWMSANLNGDRFVSDPRTRLTDNDCLLILSSDAGG